MDTEKMNNLLVMARRAREADDDESAKRYYEQVLIEDPMNWEAFFYVQYCTVYSGKVVETPGNFRRFSKTIPAAVDSIASAVKDKAAALSALQEILDTIKPMPKNLYQSVCNNSALDNSDRAKVAQSGIGCFYAFGDAIEKNYPDDRAFLDIAIASWKLGVQQQVNWRLCGYPGEELNSHIAAVQKYEPSYVKPKINSGCITVAKR